MIRFSGFPITLVIFLQNLKGELMLKKTIKYTDYNGVEREEDFYFNISKAEIGDMEFSTPGGLSEHIKRIIQTQDTKQVYKMFKEIVLNSYGEKSADGRRFIKRDADGNRLAVAFSETDAYSELFMELISDEENMANFINGVVPKDLRETAEQKKNRQNLSLQN